MEGIGEQKGEIEGKSEIGKEGEKGVSERERERGNTMCRFHIKLLWFLNSQRGLEICRYQSLQNAGKADCPTLC